MEDDPSLPPRLGSREFEETAKPVWKKEAGAAVVLSAEGYGPFERGKAIEGIEDATAEDGVFAFHAGTARSADGSVVTAGGRVLVVAARARGLSQALARAVAAAEKVRFDGKHFRRDMGTKAMEILRERTGSGLS
jgi:phosphoribosylamine--glycine ligase